MGGAEALCVPRGEVGRAEKQRGAVAHGGAGRRGGTDGRVRGERGRVLRRLNTQLLLGATDWRVCGEDCVHGRKCGTWGPVGLRDLISKDGRDSGFDPQWSRYFCPQSVFSSRSQPPPVFSPTSRIHYTSLRVASAMLTLRPLPSLRVASLSPSLLLLRPSRALAHASRYPGRAEPCPVARSRRRDGARHAESRPIPRLAMSAAPIAAALGATDEKENEPLDPVTDSEKEAPEPPDAPLAADAAEREPRPGRGRANPRSAPRRESPRAQQAGEGTPSLRSNAELMAEGGKDAGSGGGVGGGGGRRKTGASVGVDYGGRRTGVAVSYSGFAPRPITVLTTRGPQLVADLLKLARDEGADELVVGLPVSWDQSEGPQAATCRQFAQSLAKPAAVQGVRVFLHDEYSTSQDALDLMIQSKDRQEMLDAFAAAVLLRSYFESQGVNATAVLPKSKLLQQKLCSRQHAPDATAQQFSAASESLGTPDSTSAVKASAPTQDNAGSAAAAGVTVSAMPATEQGRRAVTPHRVTSSKKGASRSSKESSWVVKSRDDYGDDEDDDDSLFDGDWEAAFKLK
ncbi:unnamed protein product [Closterium sp. NIES-53]